MEKLLVFNEQGTAADVGETVHDVAAYPLSKFKGFTNTGTTNTQLQMIFEGMEEGSADGDASSVDTITLTITANKQYEAMLSIWNFINSDQINGVYVIWDELSSLPHAGYVSGCAISISSAD